MNDDYNWSSYYFLLSSTGGAALALVVICFAAGFLAAALEVFLMALLSLDFVFDAVFD